MTPTNTRATRRARLDELLRGRGAGYALGLGTIGALVVGAALRSPPAMLAGPLVVVGVVLGVAWRTATVRAAQDFFTGFATGHGMTYRGEQELLPLTPLLAAGERRYLRHFIQGPLGGDDGLACGLGHYTYETCDGDDDGHGHWRSHRFTVCVVDLEPAITMFPGVFLEQRRDLVGTLTEERWLSRHGRREVELESVAFSERYELLVDQDQDELLLRELFAPSLIVWLADHPLAPCFEYAAGTLVVYLRRRLEDAGSLNLLLDATREIAGRVRAEVAERPQAGVHT